MQTLKQQKRKIYQIKKSKEKYEGMRENFDYVVCKICGFYAAALSGHLASHNISTNEYRSKYNCETVCENYSNKMSISNSGEKNPGYQHGGRLSPYSKKFLHEDRYDPSELAKKASKTCKENSNLTTTLEYYTSRGYTQKEAEEALSERQTTFSLEKCIEKYGEEDGYQKWLERQEKWQITLNSKSDEEKQEINKKKLPKIGRISNAEKEIYDILKETYPYIKKQYSIPIKDSIYNYHYDIIINNKIIEYNGDYWHCNPNKYKETDMIKRNNKIISVKEIWNKDAHKHQVAIDNGYKLLVIWEHDYKTNPKETILKCINFLTT